MIKLDKDGGTKEYPVYCLTLTYDNQSIEEETLKACELLINNIETKAKENANEQQ